MKYIYQDSQINWFGSIPKHWKIKKLTELTTFTVGFTPSTSNSSFYGGNHQWVTIDDLDNNKILKTKNTLTDLAIEKKKDKIAKKGSVLYSFKLSVGKTAFVETDVYTNEAIAAFQPNTKIDMRFFKYSISCYLINYAKENIYGAPLLNSTLIKCSRVLYPPIEEQKAIADYLDNACMKIEKVIQLKFGTSKVANSDISNSQIKILLEYKDSLIYECVTGKKQIYKGNEGE